MKEMNDMKTYDHKPFGDGSIEVPEDKKIQDMLVESADVSDIIEKPWILYDMFLKFGGLNYKFNELKKESCFIWKWKHPNFLHLILAPSNGSTHRFSLAGSIRMSDELLNITPAYMIPENYFEEYYSNPLFIRFVEVYREQLFRFIHHINLGSLIKTKREFQIYCPNISIDEFMRLYRKYNIPRDDDAEWDPEAQCHRSLQQILREEKEEDGIS
jgi:hypothetical protein